MDAIVPVSLNERQVRIERIMDRTALELGAELAGAKRDHPQQWQEWVDMNLPIKITTAERLVAIYEAFKFCTPEQQAALPTARSALYELTALPASDLHMAIDSGSIHPGMTHREAEGLVFEGYIRPPRLSTGPMAKANLDADVLAQELLRYRRKDLDLNVLIALRRWLGPGYQWPLDERKAQKMQEEAS